ncbi:hypothetical protein QR680_014011 [Steinernema hermaphroditum]|uniref:dUTP diphosphatase n=1 Tax=Steinernema hermaphroditum TaxID=289476 RepID=A0AA39IA08_9BILA|nr:hypothetical protein QR680_014011 [Steinernema hermaphroditum]
MGSIGGVRKWSPLVLTSFRRLPCFASCRFTRKMPEVLAEAQNQTGNVVESKKQVVVPEATARITPFLKLSETAANLEEETSSVAGVQLRAAEEATVPARGKTCISTEIQMAIPEGFYGRIAPLDTLAEKHMIQTGAGVIDSDYRGTIKVLLFNYGTEEVKIPVGEAIARIPIEEIYAPSEIKWKKLDENATLPVIGSQLAAGADLTSAEECVVPAGGQKLVTTNLCADFPEDCYGRIAPRSGLAAKKFIHVGGGVCAARNEPIRVLLFNHSQEDFTIAVGDRIAQFVLQKAAPTAARSDDVDENGEPKAKCARTNGVMFVKIAAPSEFTVEPRGKATVSVDITQTIPEGYYARVAPLFSLATKNSIDVGGNLVTNGSTSITIFNHGGVEKKFEKDEPIAQLIFEKAEAPSFKLQESLEETTRGSGGFGSTGVSSS